MPRTAMEVYNPMPTSSPYLIPNQEAQLSARQEERMAV